MLSLAPGVASSVNVLLHILNFHNCVENYVFLKGKYFLELLNDFLPYNVSFFSHYPNSGPFI